jgi:predicted glycoside hydrolase/deacetylase ChbG (UPF0249 family)
MKISKMTHPILCADDFGYSHGISLGILTLLEKKKINATSVMVESPLIETYAPLLIKQHSQGQIGLHFNLTEPYKEEAYSLLSLILTFHLSTKNKKVITQRLIKQLEMFEHLFGCPPDFIDGHQHIHVLPVVRDIFLNVIAQRYQKTKAPIWIRQVSPRLSCSDSLFKRMILKGLNLGFRTRCRYYGFTYNTHFDGVYSLSSTAPYQTFFSQWLARSLKTTVIMCHPSQDLETFDSISEARLQEFQVLMR